MVTLLLIAGYETTVNLIATGTLLLLTNPDQLARLRDPARVAGAGRHRVRQRRRRPIPRSERLDLERADNHHLSFGLGHHYCWGAPLAGLQGRVAIGSLGRRFPGLRLAVPPQELRWRRGVSVRSLRSLPVPAVAGG
jgi:cytochrome P450